MVSVRFWFLLLVVGGFASNSATASLSFSPITPSTRLIVYTDELPDDLASYVAMASYFSRTQGQNLLFVTVDGDVWQKAAALANTLHILGLRKARVVAGNPNALSAIRNPQPMYVADYGKGQTYLQFLANLNRAAPLKDDYLDVTLGFIRESGSAFQALLLANPSTFVETIAAMPPEEAKSKISQAVQMGLWKGVGASKEVFTSYNANTNLLAGIVRLKEIQTALGFPLVHLPSQLFWDIQGINDKALLQYQRFFKSAPVYTELVKQLEKFSSTMFRVLTANYGGFANHIFQWTPESGLWLQDALAFLAMTSPHASLQNVRRVSLKWQTGTFDSLGGLFKNNQVLGVPLEIHEDPAGLIYEVGKLDLDHLSPMVEQSYASASNPSFQIKEDIATGLKKLGPVGATVKTSADDADFVLALSQKLQFLATEGLATGLTAAVYEEVFKELGRSAVPVIPGRGHQDLDALVAQHGNNVKVEAELIKRERMGWGVLTAEQIKAAQSANAGTLSAVAGIHSFLDAHPEGGVQYVCLTSLGELLLALQTRPDLISRLSAVHVMGGSRRAGEVNVLTRNWKLDPASTQAFFDLVQNHRLPTYVYGSQSLSGFLQAHDIPKSVKSKSTLGASHPIFGRVETMREAWFEAGVYAFAKPSETDLTQKIAQSRLLLGPSLARMMAVVVALGDQAGKYFGLRPITVKIEPPGADGNPTVTYGSSPQTVVFDVVGLGDSTKDDFTNEDIARMDEALSALFDDLGSKLAPRRPPGDCKQELIDPSRH